MGESKLPGNFLNIGITYFCVAKGSAFVEDQFRFILEVAKHGLILIKSVFQGTSSSGYRKTN